MIIAQLFFPIVGLVYVICGFRAVAKVCRMRLWPSVPAEVLNANIRWDVLGQVMARKLQLSYRYFVDGKAFTSSRITVSDFLFAQGEFLIRHIVRRHVLPGPKAYYDPHDPRNAVLVRPGFALPLGMFVMAAACFALPFLLRYAKHGP